MWAWPELCEIDLSLCYQRLCVLLICVHIIMCQLDDCVVIETFGIIKCSKKTIGEVN